MRNQIQRELDRAEEYVLTALFGDISSPRLSPKVKLFLVAKNISFDEFINEKIDMFETFSKDFMNEDGYYIGERLSKALSIQYPQLQGLEIPDIKPIDFFKAVNQLVGLEKLGQIIQNI
jgi:hypothetical protein